MLLTACRTTIESFRAVQLVVDGRPAQQRFKSITDNYHEWQTFSVKGRFSISDYEGLSASMQLRMVNGRYVYISLRGGMGIEGGRIFITGDSIYIVDKINKCYVADVVSAFTAGIEIPLEALQGLLIGRAFGIENAVIGGVGGDGSFMVSTTGNDETCYRFIFDCYNLFSTMVADSGTGYSSCSAGYDGYVETSHGIVATSWAIVSRLQDGAQVIMQAEYSPSSIVWNREMNDKFSINANYNRIDTNQLLQQLGNEL